MGKYKKPRRPAAVYTIRLPDGRIVRRHTSKVDAPEATATAFVYKSGKVGTIVWAGEPRWLGEFGRLRAKRIA